MTASRIDGRAISARLDQETKEGTTAFRAARGRVPGLAAVLLGHDPASDIYVSSKVKRTRAAGMNSFEHRLPDTTSEAKLLQLIRDLNDDDKVDGILVQLPLPKQIEASRVIAAISPDKDVDGFHVVNAGRLAVGQNTLTPCTPLGCLIMARDWFDTLAGVECVVIGRSNIVGRPMAQLLLNARATVSIVHSATKDVAGHARRADLLIAAAGRAGLVRGDWIKPGAVVIDVGINRIDSGKIVGDVVYDEAIEVARAVTPVPGGVGPMTIACLLKNTLTAARRREGLPAD